MDITETKNKIRVSSSGENSFWYGRKHTQGAKDKVSKSKLGISRTEETKLKLSLSMKGNTRRLGKIHTAEAKLKMSIAHINTGCKAVLQYDLNKQFIKKWKSVKEAVETLKLKNSGISAVCNGRRLTHGKFYWKYEK